MYSTGGGRNRRGAVGLAVESVEGAASNVRRMTRSTDMDDQESSLFVVVGVVVWFDAASPAAADRSFARFRSYIPA